MNCTFKDAHPFTTQETTPKHLIWARPVVVAGTTEGKKERQTDI
jgi:hypothetical protein